MYYCGEILFIFLDDYSVSVFYFLEKYKKIIRCGCSYLGMIKIQVLWSFSGFVINGFGFYFLSIKPECFSFQSLALYIKIANKILDLLL